MLQTSLIAYHSTHFVLCIHATGVYIWFLSHLLIWFTLASVQLNALFSDSQRELEATSQQLQSTAESLVSTQGQLAETQANLHKTREERDEKSFLVEEHIRNEQTLFTEAEEVNNYTNLLQHGLRPDH